MDLNIKQKKSRYGKKAKISFDEEIITKDNAERLLSEHKDETEIKLKEKAEQHTNRKVKNREKKKKRRQNETTRLESKATTDKSVIKPEKSKSKQLQEPNLNEESVTENKEAQDTQKQNKKESIRSRKRKRHAELLDRKKLKVELDLQQKALNYLSKWKHSNSDWKFEKLRQVWLQQNLFDSSKISNDFWETTVEYFTGAKGYSRQVVLDTAIKMVEKEENADANLDEKYYTQIKRARDIIQNLQ